MKDEILMIVNPTSGVDVNKDTVIETAARLLESQGLRLNVEFTKAKGDASKLASAAIDGGCRTVIAAGGDGTVREVANALWGSSTALGILPLGSGNGLARSLWIPQDYEKAIKIVGENHVINIDRGTANGHHFYSAFGVGFDAEVSYRFALDPHRGRKTYIKYALKELFTYKPRRYKIETDEGILEVEALLIAVCNCMQYGNNAYISPNADPTDGKLDITVVHQGNLALRAVAGFDLISGRLDQNVLVDMFCSGSVSIEPEDGNSLVHLDGEPVKTSLPVRIDCEVAGLRVVVPSKHKAFQPIISPAEAMWDDIVVDLKKRFKQ